MAARMMVTPNASHLPFSTSGYPTIWVAEQMDQSLALDSGECLLHQITKPAMLLRDSLFVCLRTTRRKRSTSIDENQVHQLQKILDFLAVAAHMASVESIMKSYSGHSRSMLMSKDVLTKKFGTTICRGGGDSGNTTMTKSSATYLEDSRLMLNTYIGPAKARMLSARWHMRRTTLALEFEYPGFADHDLSPFKIRFTRHELWDYYPLPLFVFTAQTRYIPPCDFRLERKRANGSFFLAQMSIILDSYVPRARIYVWDERHYNQYVGLLPPHTLPMIWYAVEYPDIILSS